MYRPLGVNLIEIKKSIEPKKLFHNVNSEMLTNEKNVWWSMCIWLPRRFVWYMETNAVEYHKPLINDNLSDMKSFQSIWTQWYKIKKEWMNRKNAPIRNLFQSLSLIFHAWLGEVRDYKLIHWQQTMIN